MFYYKEIIRRSSNGVRIRLVNDSDKFVSWIDLLNYTLYMPDVLYIEYKDDSDALYSKLYKNKLRSKDKLSSSSHVYKCVNLNTEDDFCVYGLKKPY